MKYYTVHIRLTYSYIKYEVRARTQEEAILKGIDRAEECDATEENKIEAAHCIN